MTILWMVGTTGMTGTTGTATMLAATLLLALLQALGGCNMALMQAIASDMDD